MYVVVDGCSGSIVPSNSNYKVLPSFIEIFLKKITNTRWKMLSTLSHAATRMDDQRPDTSESVKLKESLHPITNGWKLSSPQAECCKSITATNGTMDEHLSSESVINHTSCVSSAVGPSSTSQQTAPSTCGASTSKENMPPSNYAAPTTIDGPISAKFDSTSGYSNNSLSSEGIPFANAEITLPNVHPEVRGHPITISPQSEYDQSTSTGLVNIGNSCFMNSVLQCLGNTLLLRDYFTQDRYLNDINEGNPLGFKGELARQFATVVRRLWSGKSSCVSLHTLKAVIANRISHFEGYQQQDSHELMSILLDGLHEDLNRVLKKPIVPPVESDGHSEADYVSVAGKAWEMYRLRNDSYFVDHFQGQFKSTLVCPVCQKVWPCVHSIRKFMLIYIPYP